MTEYSLTLTVTATVGRAPSGLSPALHAALAVPEVQALLARSVMLDLLQEWAEEATARLGEDAKTTLRAALPSMDEASRRWWGYRLDEALTTLFCCEDAVTPGGVVPKP